MEGANRNLFRNIVLMGAFWTGVVCLVKEAKANIYESEGAVREVSMPLTPSTVPAAETAIGASPVSADSGGQANHGGTQVQTVTVQANPEASNSNSNSNAAEALSKARNNTESANNSLLLQQLELDRLKAEQARVTAINQFGKTLEKPCYGDPCDGHPSQLPAPPPAPCGIAPCVPTTAAPAVDVDKTVIVNDSFNGNTIEKVEEEKSGSFWHDTKWGISPILGYRWFTDTGMAHISNNYLVGAGVAMEVNKWFSGEGAFIYGNDKISGCTTYGGCTPHHPIGLIRVSDRDSYEFTVGGKVGPRMNFFRPYASFAVGALIQSYDFEDGNRTSYNFEGNIGGGVDFTLAKNFSVGIRADYQAVFGSSDQWLADIYGDDMGRYRVGGTATYTF
jgi:hypothetical protein